MNPQTDNHFDLIAIGGGSGGLAVAETAAQLGKRVAIVESKAMGGTCVNQGCVPKKVMWYAAHLAHASDDANGFGVPTQKGATDWSQLVAGRNRYVSNIVNYWDGYVDDLSITPIQGYAQFIAPVDGHAAIRVNDTVYTSDHIVIATGGKPMVPPVPGAELGITSDDFFKLEEQPEKVAMIGGGFIGVELSGVMNALGSSVSLYAREARLLEHFDAMIGDVLMQEMLSQGVELNMQANVTALEKTDAGIVVVNGDKRSEPVDTVIWAIGRAANTQGLNLAEAGVKVNDNGVIPVDAYENTNVPGIYAIGDITGRPALTPVAVDAGRKLAARLFANQPKARVDYDNIPSVVFAHPAIATMGLSEEKAKARYDRVSVYQTQFNPMRYALSEHQSTTAMKLVCVGEEERVVGLHILGDGADEMLQGFAVAITMGATKAHFDATMAIHPTSGEELVTLKQPTAVYQQQPLKKAS